MLTQVWSCFQVLDRVGASPLKVIESFGWSPAAWRFQRRRRLKLGGSTRGHSQDHGVGFCNIALGYAGGRFRDLIGDILKDEIFGQSDIQSLGDRPAIRRGLEFQLRFRE